MQSVIPTIRPYQAEGLEFLVSHPRAALFDEPGLGKCMQSLLAMRDLVPDGPILIVSPGDAIGVWQDEIEFWLDEDYGTFAGVGAPREALGHDRFVITNYHRLADALAAQSWSGVIFDECQALRNRNTRTLFKAVRHYFDRRQYGLGKVPAFFLSGTPIVKSVGDLWPILHLVDKRRWSSYWNFVKKYAIVWEDHYGWHVEDVANPKGLWEEVATVGLRRTQKEAQPWLPDTVRQRVPLKMTPKQERAYWQIEKDLIAELPTGGLLLTPTVLARETRLRQILACPRILGFDDDGAAVLALRDIAESHSRPFVVFSPFAQALPFLETALHRVGRPVYKVHGGMGERFRQSVDLFRRAAAAGESPVLLSTVQMGKGWSVSKVTHECYQLSWDWNNTTQRQAEARLGRDGQTETVFSRYFVHRDTHDEDALQVLNGKRRLADVILDRMRRRQQ